MLILPAGAPVMIAPTPWVGDDLAEGKRVLSSAAYLGPAVVRKATVTPYGFGKNNLQASAEKTQQPGNW